MPEEQWVDRFGGKLVLVLLDNKRGPAVRGGRSLWGMQRTLAYRPNDGLGSEITVPAGFVTDLASIPRWAWIILPPDGPWVKAAIVHDYLYATAGTGKWKRHPASITRPKPYERHEADAIMREAMENRGIGPIRRNIIYFAVRFGGGAAWRRSQQRLPPSDADEAYVTDTTPP